MHVLIPIQMGTAPNLVPISVLIVVTIGISPSAALLHITGICVGIGVGIGLCQCKHTIGRIYASIPNRSHTEFLENLFGSAVAFFR